MPESKGIWTPGLAKVLAGVISAAIATGLGLYFYLQQRDDPPVTVSDSSLHARSPKRGWESDPDIHTIRASPSNGHLQVGCTGILQGTSADLSLEGAKPEDISPTGSAPWKVTITYHGNPVYVLIDNGYLHIRDPQGSFDAETNNTGDPHHRKDHYDSGATTHIRVEGGVTPKDVDVTHFTLRACYK